MSQAVFSQKNTLHIKYSCMAPSPRRIRFGLRTFLLGVSALAVVLAVVNATVMPWYRDRVDLKKLQAVNAQVFNQPRGYYFLRQFIGDKLSQRSVYLHLDDARVTDQWLRDLQGMKYIEVLSIKSVNLTDDGLKELKKFPNLLDLNLVDTQTTEDGLAALRQALPKLKRIQSTKSADLTAP